MSWMNLNHRIVKPYYVIKNYITANDHTLPDGTVMPAGSVCAAFRDEELLVHLVFRINGEKVGIKVGKVGLLGFDPGFTNPKLRTTEYVTKVCQAVDVATQLWKDAGDVAAEKFLMLSFPDLCRTYLPKFRINLTALSDDEARDLVLQAMIEEAKKAVAEDLDKLALDEMEKALSSSNEQVLTENQAEETSGTSDH